MAQSDQEPDRAPPSLTQRPGSDTAKQAPSNQAETRKREIKVRVAEWLRTCLADWDQSTHMTKKEWRNTCERVATERGKFLLDNPTVGSTFLDDARDRQR
jgi:hypothetical protein